MNSKDYTKREVYMDVSVTDDKIMDLYLCDVLLTDDGTEPKVTEQILRAADENLIASFMDVFSEYLREDIRTVYFATNLLEVENFLLLPTLRAWKSLMPKIVEAKGLYESGREIRPIDCISMSRVRSVAYFDDITYLPREFRLRAKSKYHEALTFAKEEKDSFLFLQTEGDALGEKVTGIGAILTDRNFEQIKCFFDGGENDETLISRFGAFLEEKKYRFDVYADVSFPMEYAVFEQLNRFIGFPKPPYIFDLRSMMAAIGKDMDRELETEALLGTDISSYSPLAKVEYAIRLYKEYLRKPIEIRAGKISSQEPEVISRHTFYLPFEWQMDEEYLRKKKAKTTTATWLHRYLFYNNPAWECSEWNEDEWQEGRTSSQVNEIFTLYQALTPTAFNVTFGEGDASAHYTAPVRIYRLRLAGQKKNTIVMKRGMESFYLRISEVRIKVLRAGIAILMIDADNIHYSSVNDIDRISEYGQRLNLQYLPRYGEESDFAEVIDMRLYLEGVDKPYHFTTDFVSAVLQKVWKKEKAPLAYFPECMSGLLFDYHKKSRLLIKPLVENKMYTFTSFRNSRLVHADIGSWNAFVQDGVWYAGDADSFAVCREDDTPETKRYTAISDLLCKELFSMTVLRDVLLKRLNQEIYHLTYGKEEQQANRQAIIAKRKQMHQKYLTYKSQLFVDEPVYDEEMQRIYMKMQEKLRIGEKERLYLERAGERIHG